MEKNDGDEDFCFDWDKSDLKKDIVLTAEYNFSN